MLTVAECTSSCRTALPSKLNTIYACITAAGLQVCVLDAQSGSVYLKLPHSRDWPLAPDADTYPGACDGMLR
jgi:hypothetical protein